MAFRLKSGRTYLALQGHAWLQRILHVAMQEVPYYCETAAQRCLQRNTDAEATV